MTPRLSYLFVAVCLEGLQPVSLLEYLLQRCLPIIILSEEQYMIQGTVARDFGLPKVGEFLPNKIPSSCFLLSLNYYLDDVVI